MVYWYLYIHFTRDTSIVDKLLASSLPAYHTGILDKLTGRYRDRTSDLQLHLNKPVKRWVLVDEVMRILETL